MEPDNRVVVGVCDVNEIGEHVNGVRLYPRFVALLSLDMGVSLVDASKLT